MLNRLYTLAGVAGLLFGASCAGTSAVKDEGAVTEEGIIAAVNLQATQDGDRINAHARVWYGVRLVEKPTDDGGDHHDYTIDVYSPATYEALRSLPDGAPELEGIQYIIEDEKRLWVSCAFDPERDLDDSWCLIAVPPPCWDNACVYDFRVSHEPFSEGIPEGRDWNADPDGWARGQFYWENEFGSARMYGANYEHAAMEHLGMGPDQPAPIELRVEGGEVHLRGWIRRLEEDEGIIVEPRYR